MVGCNNPRVRPDLAHIELMKKMVANDIIIIASGCSAQAAAKAGLMDKAAKDICGAGLKRVCELADIPPVLHMGSCVDISRMLRPDLAHIELMKKMVANDIIIIASGCSAQAAAKAGLMDKAAKDICGAGLKRVCELADIPPVLHMGSCVDISRMLVLAATLAKDAGLHISQLPVVGCAPEWMSEKAVSFGNYVIGSGIDTFLCVDPYASGSSEMVEILTNGTREWCEAAFTVENLVLIHSYV